MKHAKHRSKDEIIVHILKIVNSEKGVVQTRIAHESLMSWKQLRNHLSFLVTVGLIEYQEEDHTFVITQKGKNFLNVYSMIDQLIAIK